MRKYATLGCAGAFQKLHFRRRIDILNLFHSGLTIKRVGSPTLLFYMEDTKRKITELADSIAGRFGVDIVDVELAGSSRRPLIRIFIDKENGVTLDDCGEFSRSLSALLDVEDPIPTSYVLEVSSPGLDRPLKGLKDYRRSIGKLARIITRERIEEQNIFRGRITGVKEDTITLLYDEREIEIPFDKISKARLEIELK